MPLNSRRGAIITLALLVGSCAGIASPLLKEVHALDRDDKPLELVSELDDGSEYSVGCTNYISETGKITGASLDVPVMRFSCGRSEGSRGNAIWIYGGPFARFGESLLPEQMLLLELGYDLIVPFYPGSADRKYRVVAGAITPDLQQAFEEVAQLITVLQNVGPVVLAGESFGAILALTSNSRLRSEDRLLLAGPMLVSYRDALVFGGVPASRVLAVHGKSKEVALTFPEGVDISIANQADQNRKTGDGRPIEASTPDEVALIVSFMQDWLYTSPLANFSNPNGAKVLVLAGELDPFATKGDVDRLVQIAGPNATAILLSGQGHGGVRSLKEIDLLRRYLLTADGAGTVSD